MLRKIFPVGKIDRCLGVSWALPDTNILGPEGFKPSYAAELKHISSSCRVQRFLDSRDTFLGRTGEIRLVKAQTSVAAVVRGHFAREDRRLKHRQLEGAASYASRWWRRFLSRRQSAARRLQAIARGANARKKYAELVIAVSHAVVIQTAVRIRDVIYFFFCRSSDRIVSSWGGIPLLERPR